MNIRINDKLYLRSDSCCCWLCKVSVIQKGKNKGNEREEVIGYYARHKVFLHQIGGFKCLSV